jgi:hypothetical protein
MFGTRYVDCITKWFGLPFMLAEGSCRWSRGLTRIALIRGHELVPVKI